MYKDKTDYNSYMSEYMLKRYYQRRQKSFDILGGKCAGCGCIPDNYEFDHIDPTTKLFTIAKLWSVAEEKYLEEIKKCQILCKECHAKKSITESNKKVAKGTHGTISSYRYCRCDLCKTAKSSHNRLSNDKRNARRRESRLKRKLMGYKH